MAIPTRTHETDLATIAAMAARGHFHAHQDGRWRYSPFGGETSYCSDPTSEFPMRAEFNGRAVGCAPRIGLYFLFHRDGTRGMTTWDRDRELVLRQLYPPYDETHRMQRDWLFERMP